MKFFFIEIYPCLDRVFKTMLERQRMSKNRDFSEVQTHLEIKLIFFFFSDNYLRDIS